MGGSWKWWGESYICSKSVFNILQIMQLWPLIASCSDLRQENQFMEQATLCSFLPFHQKSAPADDPLLLPLLGHSPDFSFHFWSSPHRVTWGSCRLPFFCPLLSTLSTLLLFPTYIGCWNTTSVCTDLFHMIFLCFVIYTTELVYFQNRCWLVVWYSPVKTHNYRTNTTYIIVFDYHNVFIV